jgi:TadE-like protein
MMKPKREMTYAGPAGRPTGGAPYTDRVRGINDEHGQAVTEFAMVLPLFALLVIVCILFGKTLYVYIQLTHSANEAARLAAVNQPQSGSSLCSFLNGEAALPTGTKLAITYNDGGLQSVGEPVTVKATPVAGASWVPFIGGSLDLSASATMRLEQDTSSNSLLANNATCTA